MDLKLEYQPDGSRRKVDLDAPEDPALRYEASPRTTQRYGFFIHC